MLFTQETVFQFWPTIKQTPIQRIESTARFIIYGSLIAFALKRNVKILILGTVLLIGLFFYSNQTLGVSFVNGVNAEDPFGNLPMNKVYNPSATKQWAQDTFSSDVRNAERNFYTAPSNNLDSFLEFVYGGNHHSVVRINQHAQLTITPCSWRTVKEEQLLMLCSINGETYRYRIRGSSSNGHKDVQKVLYRETV